MRARGFEPSRQRGQLGRRWSPGAPSGGVSLREGVRRAPRSGRASGGPCVSGRNRLELRVAIITPLLAEEACEAPSGLGPKIPYLYIMLQDPPFFGGGFSVCDEHRGRCKGKANSTEGKKINWCKLQAE